MSQQTVNDYSGGASSPQAHVTIAGSMSVSLIAAAFATLAFGGVLVMAILLPSLIERTAAAASARGVVRMELAERDSKLALDKIEDLRVAVASQGANDHVRNSDHH